ncbi:hypothetical protein BDQ17DRAFT_1537699 [Cyathus striatus]|nr:hypothetical protein BDQ17DRAFT_1537699 [Cyathus striatus]
MSKVVFGMFSQLRVIPDRVCRISPCHAVGNVPYTMGEEQLIDVFKSVGQVIGFRLVFDRDTGKPKGYGFCEFADHETALSAVRNLNNVDVGGRPLRIDLADSDPFLEGKTTVRGELVDGGTSGAFEPRSQWRGGTSGGGRSNDPDAFLAGLPPGLQIPKGASSLDYISSTLASMPPPQLMEVLAQMKAFVITHPIKQSGLGNLTTYVGGHVSRRYRCRSCSATLSATDARPADAYSATPATFCAAPSVSHASVPTYGDAPAQPLSAPPMSAPPASALYPHHQPPHPGMPPMPQYYRPPPPTTTASPAPPAQQPPPSQPTPNIPNISDTQKSMLMQVLSMTPDQITALPETERNAIMQLREQFMGTLGASANMNA